MTTRTHRLGTVTGVLLAGLLITLTACTRDPYNEDRDARLNTDAFTYSPVIDPASIWTVKGVSTDDGRMGLAIGIGMDAVTVVENVSGSWVEVTTLNESGLQTTIVDIAPQATDGWWVLAGHETDGVRLYRVRGSGDSTLVFPDRNETPWDSVGCALGSTAAGHPIAVLNSVAGALYRATLADTGWAYDQISGSTSAAVALDFDIDDSDTGYTLFRNSLGGKMNFNKTGPDSNVTRSFPPDIYTVEDIHMTASSDGRVRLIGGLDPVGRIAYWQEELGLDIAEAMAVEDPFLSHSAAATTAEDKPWIVVGKYKGASRYNLYLLTRAADDPGTNWEAALPIVEDAAWQSYRNRLMVFAVTVDALGQPHIIFATGDTGSASSLLQDAVPK